jgi:hypothetical protein
MVDKRKPIFDCCIPLMCRAFAICALLNFPGCKNGYRLIVVSRACILCMRLVIYLRVELSIYFFCKKSFTYHIPDYRRKDGDACPCLQ